MKTAAAAVVAVLVLGSVGFSVAEEPKDDLFQQYMKEVARESAAVVCPWEVYRGTERREVAPPTDPRAMDVLGECQTLAAIATGKAAVTADATGVRPALPNASPMKQ